MEELEELGWGWGWGWGLDIGLASVQLDLTQFNDVAQLKCLFLNPRLEGLPTGAHGLPAQGKQFLAEILLGKNFADLGGQPRFCCRR